MWLNGFCSAGPPQGPAVRETIQMRWTPAVVAERNAQVGRGVPSRGEVLVVDAGPARAPGGPSPPFHGSVMGPTAFIKNSRLPNKLSPTSSAEDRGNLPLARSLPPVHAK